MTIGDRIRAKREELGLSQDELARRLGYKSRSSINKIEKDASGLPQSKIYAIAVALDCSPGYIMGWENVEPTRTEVDAIARIIIADKELLTLVEYYAEISTRDRAVLLSLADTLRNKKQG